MSEQRTHRIVEAEEIRLVDGQGRLRILMNAPDHFDKEPSITLFDENSIGRVAIQLIQNLPRITLEGRAGPVGGMSILEDGSTVFALNRPDGKLGFLIRVPAAGEITVQVFGEDGQPIRNQVFPTNEPSHDRP